MSLNHMPLWSVDLLKIAKEQEKRWSCRESSPGPFAYHTSALSALPLSYTFLYCLLAIFKRSTDCNGI